MKRTFVYAICLSLVASLMLGAAVPALAKSERAALIKELTGTVEVVKAGGSRKLVAFNDMPLNRGDHIETGSNSSVVLVLADTGDEVTIDSNSSLYISELSDNGDGKKSKMKMWAGSLWSKVKTLAGAEDEYEIETPTAVMGVRGTHLLVGVDPESGDALFFLGSGGAGIKTKDGTTVVLPPAQQFKLFNDDSEQPSGVVSYVDMEQFVSQAGPKVIQSILESMADIIRENEELVRKMRDQLTEGGTPPAGATFVDLQTEEGLNGYAGNLEQLIGQIARTAVENNVLPREYVEGLLEEANRQTGKNVDLDNVRPFTLSDAEQQRLDRLKQQEEQRRQQLAAIQQQKEQQKQSNQNLLDRLQQQREKQQQENKKIQDQKKAQAEEKLKQQLAAAGNTEALDRFNEDKSKRDAEQVDRQPTPTPTTPTPTPVTNTPNNPTNPGGNAKPKVTFTSEKVEGDELDYALLQVDLSGFTGSNAIRGIQMHLLLSNSLMVAYDYATEPSDFASAEFGGLFETSERRYDVYEYVEVPNETELQQQIGYSDSYMSGFKELLVVELNTGAAQSVEDSFFIRIPVWTIYTAQPLKLKLADLIIVKADGTTISAGDLDIHNAPNGIITLPAFDINPYPIFIE